MQSVELNVIQLDNDVFSLQKCLLSTQSFCKLSHSRYAFLHFSEHSKCVCRFYPRCDLPDEYCQVDSSVLAFRGLGKTLYGLPERLIELQSIGSQKKVKFVENPQEVCVKKLDSSVVFESAKDAKKWNLDLKTLSNIVKNILKMFMITNDCVVSLGSLIPEARIGIHYIIVHNTGDSDKIGRVVGATKVTVTKVISRKWFDQLQNVRPLTLGGLNRPYEALKEIVTYHSRYGHLLQGVNLKPCQQVLVAGPPGCGKTSLVRKVAADCGAALVAVEGVQLLRPAPGDTERHLEEVFQEAVDLAEESGTCVLLLDEVDLVCPRRAGASTHLKRTATQLLALLERVGTTPGLAVVATTSRPQALDPALLRPGRLDSEIYIGVPTEPERCEILGVLLEPARCGPADVAALCSHVARITPGYVGADLALLCHHVLQRHQTKCKEASLGTQGSAPDLQWEQSFQAAVASIRPSSLRSGLGVVTTRPVALSDIGGMGDVKKALQVSVEWPLLHPEAFSRLGIPHPKGVLLYGPPGCAKTTVVRALATAANTTFLSVSAAELYSPYVGDAERSIVELFSRARHGAPTILFIDEIDALVGSRSNREKGVQLQVLSALLTEMDGVGIKMEVHKMTSGTVGTGVVVIAATNRPDMLDDALLRPGRFDRLIYVPPPDAESRLDILRVCSRNMPLAGDVDLRHIASSTELFSGADLANLCREAALCAMTTEGMHVEQVQHKHFQQALDELKPSLTQQQVDWYLSYKRR